MTSTWRYISRQHWLATLALASIAVIASSSAAHADDQPDAADAGRRSAALFKQLDANGDGQLALDEVAEEHQRMLKRLLRIADANADGELDESEFSQGLNPEPPAAARRKDGDQPNGNNKPGDKKPSEQARAGKPPGAGPFFARLDKNGDGNIDQDEIPAALGERFAARMKRADSDSDGLITRKEFQRQARQMAARAAGQDPATQPGGTTGGPGTRPGAGRPAGPFAIVRVLDINGDGTISSEELAAATESLKRLDRDGDGELSRREILPGPGMMAGSSSSALRRPDFQRPNFKDQKPARPQAKQPSPAQAGAKQRQQKGDAASDTTELVKEMPQTAEQTGDLQPTPDGRKKLPSSAGKQRQALKTPEQIAERRRRQFDRLDKDQNGSISWEEWQQAGNRQSANQKSAAQPAPTAQ